MSEFEKCPWCGGQNCHVHYGQKNSHGLPVGVECLDCGAHSPWAYATRGASEAECAATAVERWNTRA